MKKIWQLIIIVPIVIGVIIGIYISVNKQIKISNDTTKLANVFENTSSKTAKITKFYSYGTSLNIEGKIEGISKDNFEGIKIIITNGDNYTEDYIAETSFSENGDLNFKTSQINNSINLDNLKVRYVLYFSKTKTQ